MQNPKRVEVARPASTTETVAQTVAKVSSDPKVKRESLRELIRKHDVKNAIVFCNRKRDVSIVAKSLSKHEFNAAALHGDLAQSIRMDTLSKFRDGQIKLLVASDVAARGLDIPDVSHVFNYDVPSHAEDYVHRIGRTGRAGKSGTAVTLMTGADAKYFSAIEQLIKKEIDREEVDISSSKDEPKKTATKPRKSPKKKASDKQADNKKKADTEKKKNSDKESKSRKEIVGLGDHVPAFLLKPVDLDNKVA